VKNAGIEPGGSGERIRPPRGGLALTALQRGLKAAETD